MCMSTYSTSSSSVIGDITNKATVTGLDNRYSPAQVLTSTSSLITINQAALTVVQTVDNTGIWSIIVTNTGTASLSSFVINSGISYPSCTISSLGIFFLFY